MIKKITALAVAIAMLSAIGVCAATFTDVAQDGSESADAITLLSHLGIISGMGDGSFAPYATLTRAQFAKMAVCIMGKTKEAVVTTDAFSDVKSTDWYSGYVNVVAKEGVITGYPDGSFGANDAVTYAQAITIIVRLLGYNAEDVGHKWPQGYIDKANVLGLTEGMSFGVNDFINRENAAKIIYRALFTDMNQTKTALITKMDKNVYEDAVILATRAENSALWANQVQSSQGTFIYDAASLDMKKYVGYEGTLVTNDESEVIAFVPSEDITRAEYTVSGVYKESNKAGVSVMTEENITVTLEEKTVVYMGGGTYSADKLAEGVTPGSTIALFTQKGAVKYAFVNEYQYAGPKTVLSVSDIDKMFSITDKDSVKVIRKGLSAQWEDIELYDVLYYSEKTKTVYAYTDKVTGLYEKAYPMKSNVSKVTVAGGEYTLSTIDAVNRLNESAGAFDIGDRVTLLLGKDGDVVDAVSLTEDRTMYGVVTGTSSAISDEAETKGRTEYYVHIILCDTTSVKYKTKDDKYSDDAGKFCRIDFSDGYAELKFPAAVAKSGTVSREKKSFGGEPFAQDVTVLEYIKGTENHAEVIVLTLADIDKLKLTKSDVRHIKYNSDGEIELLYLDNASGNGSVYGIITELPETTPGAYKMFNGSSTYTVSGTYPSYAKGDCVQYYDSGKGATFNVMSTAGKGVSISDITDNVLMMNAQSYILSDSAVFLAGKHISDLKAISKEDALNLSGSITLYAERSVSTGGKIRIVKIITG